MRKKLLSILTLLCLTVSGAWAESVTWSGSTLTNIHVTMGFEGPEFYNNTNIGGSGIDVTWSGNGMGGWTGTQISADSYDCTLTFTYQGTDKGITSIVFNANNVSGMDLSSGWSIAGVPGTTLSWSGSAAKTVTLSGNMLSVSGISSVVITFSENHTLVPHPAVAATCTTAGNSAYWECTECHKYFSNSAGTVEIAANSWIIAATGHTLIAHAAAAATCTDAGNTAYWSCDNCHKYFSDAEGTTQIDADSWVIAASGHTLTANEAVAATCTTAGSTAYWSCSVCGKYFSDAAGTSEIAEDSWVIPATGHTLTEHAAVAATCTDAGNTAYWSCDNCHKYFSDAAGTSEIAEDSWVIAATGHTLNKHEAVEATCMDNGTSAYWQCTACGKYFSDVSGTTETTAAAVVIDALGHDLVEQAAVAATCTTAGRTAYQKCSRCDYKTDYEDIPALGHDIVYHEAVAATCTTAGHTAYEDCSRCDYIYGYTEIPATGHHFTGDECDYCNLIRIPYIDADGKNQYCEDYTVLDGNETEIGVDNQSTWYVVNSNIEYTSQLRVWSSLNLILVDDKTMTVTVANDDAIFGASSPVIYGQSKGTGTLTVNATASEKAAFSISAGLTINGGTINATGQNDGIYTVGDVTINGGTVSFTGNKRYAIWSQNLTINGGSVDISGDGGFDGSKFTCNDGTVTITTTNNGIASSEQHINGGKVSVTSSNNTAITGGYLYVYGGDFSATGGTGDDHYGVSSGSVIIGWTNPSDKVCISSYFGGPFSVVSGKTFTDGTTAYSGNLVYGSNALFTNTAELNVGIGGKTLYPALWDIANGANGSESSPYIISSTAELDQLAAYVNSGVDFENTFFKLGDNITYSYTGLGATESNYTRIGKLDLNLTRPGDYAPVYFNGTFDGDGKTIRGIRIYPDASNPLSSLAQALFGVLGPSATVKNVNLDDTQIAGSMAIGGIAGMNYGGTIKNCTSRVTIVPVGSMLATMGYGGIVGLHTGTVENCTSYATITAGDGAQEFDDFGGIVGYSVNGIIRNCSSFATIAIGNSAKYCQSIGGIAGWNSTDEKQGSTPATIENCISSATITIGLSPTNCGYIGGIVGQNTDGNLTGNLAINVELPKADTGVGNVGAIIGGIVEGDNNSSRGVRKYNYYSGCTIGNTANAQDIGCGNYLSKTSDIDYLDGAVYAIILSETQATMPTLNENDKVVFRREFTKDVASTICLPFGIDQIQIEEAGKFYTFAGIDKSGEIWKVIMADATNKVTADHLTANTPYLFMPAATGPVLFHGEAAATTSAGTTSDTEGWTFKGTYATKLWDDTNNTEEIGKVYGFAAQGYEAPDNDNDGNPDYTVSPGNFVKAAAGASIAPFRAYLQFTASGSGAKQWRGAPAVSEILPSLMAVILVDADNADGIGPMDNGQWTMDNEAWYDLSGRKLDSAPKTRGIYIHNGKKVILK